MAISYEIALIFEIQQFIFFLSTSASSGDSDHSLPLLKPMPSISIAYSSHFIKI